MAQSHANRAVAEKPTLIVVHPGSRRKWEVTPGDQARPQSFSELELAVSYAQLWGAIHRPSIVTVIANDGGVKQEWWFN
jgi:hypothetical protein